MDTSRGGSRARATTPRQRFAWLTEVALLAAFYAGYEMLRALCHPAAAVAIGRARAIARGESWLHVAVERGANALATHDAVLGAAAGYYYATLHFVVTPAMLIWLWRYRPAAYAHWRRVLAVATVASLIIYWLLPVAPPRFALRGLTDTLVAHNVLGAADPHGVSGLVNKYAAVPSLHVAWAFWVALAAFRSVRHGARWLAWAYPIATASVVVLTANHFLVDALAGIAVVLAAWAAAVALQKRAWQHRRFALTLSRGAGATSVAGVPSPCG
jgi:small-conductance mechanosensitive channel